MRKTIRRWIAALLMQLGMFDLALWARGWPMMAGGAPDDDDGSDDDQGDGGDGDGEEEGSEDEDGDDESDDDGDDADDDDEEKFPDKAKEIIRKERKARRDAERRAKAAERAAKPKPKPAPKKPAKDDADDGKDDQLDAVTAKLRRSNLRAALAESTVQTDKVKAALNLIDLDDVEYDEDDEPTNLDDVLETAFETYPFLKGNKPKAPNVNGRDGKGNKTPKLTADELDAAKQAGKTPEEWEALKGVESLADWRALQDKRQKAAAK